MPTAATQPLPGARERQRLETRERLFRAGLDEIRGVGLAAAQVDRIAAAVGISRGAFYFHYPTKADLLLDWERRREAELVLRLARSDRRSLRASLLEVASFLADLLGSSEGTLVLEVLAIHLQHAADPQDYVLLAAIERRLGDAAVRGELRRDVDAHQLAILFLSNVFGFLVARTNARPPLLAPELLVDAFLSGAAATRAPRRDERTRAAAATGSLRDSGDGDRAPTRPRTPSNARTRRATPRRPR